MRYSPKNILHIVLCYSGSPAKRRRRKTMKNKEHNLGLGQRNRDYHQSLLRRRDQVQNYDSQRNSSTIITNRLSIPSSVTVTTISQQDKSIISARQNLTNEQSFKRTINSSQSKSRVSVQRVDRRDQLPRSLTSSTMLNEDDARPSIVTIQFSDLLTVPSSTPVVARTDQPIITRLSLLSKASIKSQPRESISMYLNDTRKKTIPGRCTSNVSVSRVKRTWSTSRINHVGTHNTNIPINN